MLTQLLLTLTLLLLLTPAHMHFLYTILYAVARRHKHFKSSLSGGSCQKRSVTYGTKEANTLAAKLEAEIKREGELAMKIT